jgi:hypothetical protein
MVITAVLGSAPVMAAPAGAPAGQPSLTWALPRWAVGQQLRWLLSAAPKAPLPASEIERHFDQAFLAAVSPAQVNEGLAQFPSETPWRLT